MKEVLGGYMAINCTFTNTNGTTSTISISGANGNSIQCKADAICWQNDGCSNASCGAGSGGC
jgi:hypothetical protein